jgi:quercetin dioxygenase-like cupin family protein
MNEILIKQLDSLLEQMSNVEEVSFLTFNKDDNLLFEISYEKVDQIVKENDFHLVYRKPHIIIFQVKSPTEYNGDWHYHNHAEIMTLLSGDCTFELEDETIELSVGDSITIPRNKLHRFTTKEGSLIQLTITL